MPSTPRRQLTRRSLPPRPTYPGAPGVEHEQPAPPRHNAESRRVAENTLRHAPYLTAELKRIGGITVVCLGMLAALTVIDHLR